MLLFNSFPCFFHNFFCNIFLLKSIYSPFLSLPSSWTLTHQTLVLSRYPKCSRSAHFSLNVALPLPSSVSLTPLQILISTRNVLTKALLRASLKSHHSHKVQKEQFKAEQYNKSVLTDMPSPLPSAQTFLTPASSWLVAQVPHQHQCGDQLAHHHYHQKECFQVYRGQVPIHHYFYGLCCFQHHHHYCHHRH